MFRFFCPLSFCKDIWDVESWRKIRQLLNSLSSRCFSKILVVKSEAYDSRSALSIRKVRLLGEKESNGKEEGNWGLARKEKPGLRSFAWWIIEGSVNQYTTPEHDGLEGSGFRNIIPGIRNIIKATFQFNFDILKDIIKDQPTIQRWGH